MTDTHLKIIEAATDARIKAISWDVDVNAESLKYSSWISALCTAGLFLVITNFDKIILGSWLIRSVAVYGTLISGLFLIAATIVGGIFNWMVNEQANVSRNLMTLYLRQKVEVLADESVEKLFSDLKMFQLKFIEGEFLDSTHSERFKVSTAKHSKSLQSFKRTLILQQALAVIGYLLILLCGVKSP